MAKAQTKASRIDELRGKSAAELNDEIVTLRKEEFNLRMQRGTGQLADTSRFKKIRRDVARIKTLLKQQSNEADQVDKANQVESV